MLVNIKDVFCTKYKEDLVDAINGLSIEEANKPIDGDLLIQTALIMEKPYAVEALMNKNPNLQHHNRNLFTPLHTAIKCRNHDIALKMIQMGADYFETSPLCPSPKMLAQAFIPNKAKELEETVKELGIKSSVPTTISLS